MRFLEAPLHATSHPESPVAFMHAPKAHKRAEFEKKRQIFFEDQAINQCWSKHGE
jgi:hypothetical protein